MDERTVKESAAKRGLRRTGVTAREAASDVLYVEVPGGRIAYDVMGEGPLIVLLHGVGMIMSPGAATAINTQLDALADALKPWDSGVRLSNFVDVPTDARTFYPPETLDRLQEVKRRYDPDDLFRANHPIPTPAAPVPQQL